MAATLTCLCQTQSIMVYKTGSRRSQGVCASAHSLHVLPLPFRTHGTFMRWHRVHLSSSWNFILVRVTRSHPPQVNVPRVSVSGAWSWQADPGWTCRLPLVRYEPFQYSVETIGVAHRFCTRLRKLVVFQGLVGPNIHPSRTSIVEGVLFTGRSLARLNASLPQEFVKLSLSATSILLHASVFRYAFRPCRQRVLEVELHGLVRYEHPEAKFVEHTE